jgi:hypothetical protein
MKKLQATHIYDIDPSSMNDVSGGYNLGQWWENTSTGDKFYHKTDGVWVLVGGGGTQNLQEVTDEGNITTRNIILTDGDDDSQTILTNQGIVFKRGVIPNNIEVTLTGENNQVVSRDWVLPADEPTVELQVASRQWTNEQLTNKADLVGGLIPESQLPSYVDDVLEFDEFSMLPPIGVSGKIYVTLDDNKTYRWGATSYVEVGNGVVLTLQEVTDLGNTTTNDIILNGGEIKYIDGKTKIQATPLHSSISAVDIANLKSSIVKTNLDGTLIVGSTDNIQIYSKDVLVSGQDSLFEGIKYADNYSANFTDRSLVDKAYVDANSGSTDLSYNPDSNGGVISSSTGMSANIPLATNADAGLLSPGEKVQIANFQTELNNKVDFDTSIINAIIFG